MTARGTFNVAGFYAAVDMVRATRGLRWNQVAAQANVSASTLTRLKQGKRGDIDTMAALATWAGLSLDKFIVGAPNSVDEFMQALVAAQATAPKTVEEFIRATYEAAKRGVWPA